MEDSIIEVGGVIVRVEYDVSLLISLTCLFLIVVFYALTVRNTRKTKEIIRNATMNVNKEDYLRNS